MKEKILPVATALLLFSTSAITQSADDITSAISQELSTSQSTVHRFDVVLQEYNKQNELILATGLSATANLPTNDLPSAFSDKLLSNSAPQNKTTAEETAQSAPADDAVEIPSRNLSEEERIALREVFLEAETAIKKKRNKTYFRLAKQLKDYPLYPYLQYQWLSRHLGDRSRIEQFLSEHKTSRYAKKLQRKWLYHLARHQQWPLFLEYYNNSKETRLNCYYHRAQYKTGEQQAALEGAVKLWSVGRSQPRECDPLFAQLKKSSLFTEDLLWQRFDAALRNNKVKLAFYIKKQMPKSAQTDAQLWIKLHRKPSRYLSQLLKHKKNARTALMFRHAIDRLASRDVTKAINIWDANKQNFAIDKTLASKLERRLAFKLAYERESGAYDRLGQLDMPNNSSRTWRVRVALSEQNWPNVLTALRALSDTEAEDEKWQYWLARAYLESGEVDKAQILLNELSKKRSFYGYLAADKVNSLYQLVDNPIATTTQDIANIQYRREYQVAYELKVLNRDLEAKLQWWHALRQLNKAEIITAAKLAKQWNWNEIAIFTIAKAKYWDDIEVRFPMGYADKVHENSIQQKLNPVILFGLIRRESAFNENAYSPSGARGLMQIMPGTGRQIARHFNERWHGSNSLYNPVTNLKYGSYYYQKLLTQFDGNYAIALAAYNAGPERVKKWLPETESLPADIWIETIPYHETREYVTAVLAYALIYQQRTQSSELSMNDLAQDVKPLTR